MRVLLFGALSDLAGWREKLMDPPPATVSALRNLLTEADRDLGAALARPGVQVAVDKTVVRGEAALSSDAEIAFLPPMSGG